MSLGSTNRDNTLNSWFRNTAFATLTAQMAVSLHSADPTTSGAGTEVGGSSYARQNVTFNAPSGGVVAASAALNFSGMPAATISHVGIWAGVQFQQGGALTGGSQPITSGNTFTLSSLSSSLT